MEHRAVFSLKPRISKMTIACNLIFQFRVTSKIFITTEYTTTEDKMIMIDFVIVAILTVVVGLLSWIFPGQAKYIRNDERGRHEKQRS